MNFYIDFEATQPEQEIISVGVVAENGNTFYALIKPQFSSISQFVTELTGLDNQKLQAGEDFTTAMDSLYNWCGLQVKGAHNWNFWSYSDADKIFLQHTLRNANTEKSILMTSFLIANLKDYSKEVKKYFHCPVSLIKAFNYIQHMEQTQNHNALEDAKMLAEVYNKIVGQQPLSSNPFANCIEKTAYTFPSGRFFCRTTGKKAKEIEFPCVEDAIEWLIEKHIKIEDRDAVHRDRIAIKIMKAIKKHNTYMGYKWRRDKYTTIITFIPEEELKIDNTLLKGMEIEPNKWVLLNEDNKYVYCVTEKDKEPKVTIMKSNLININGKNYEFRKGETNV